MHRMLETSKAIVEGKIDFTRRPSLLPTLVTEDKSGTSVSVLDPAPEEGEIFELVMKWKENRLQQCGKEHCIAFVAEADRIALGLFPPSEGEWHFGQIDRERRAVRWDHGCVAASELRPFMPPPQETAL